MIVGTPRILRYTSFRTPIDLLRIMLPSAVIADSHHDHASNALEHGMWTPPRLGMAMHILHLTGHAMIQPFAQAIEAIGFGRWGNSHQLKTQGAGVILDRGLQAVHDPILPVP